MTQFDKLALTRRDALKVGLAGAVASSAVLGATRAAFAVDTLAEVKKRGVLTTATEMQFPPFDISDNGTYKGLDRDLVDAVGKEMGLKVTYLDLPWTSVLPGLEAKKFDLCIAPVTITKERMKRYAFTVPIADATAALMKRADDKSIMKPEDIAGKQSAARRAPRRLRSSRNSPRNCRSRSRSRNMSTTTNPMPTSPPDASTPRSIRCPTSLTPPSSAPTRSQW